jgi:hypothetical protein
MDWAVGCSRCNGWDKWLGACTLAGGVVGWHVGGAKGGGIGGGLISWCGACRVGGFIGEALDSETVRGALGVQLRAITLSSSLSSLVRM